MVYTTTRNLILLIGCLQGTCKKPNIFAAVLAHHFHQIHCQNLVQLQNYIQTFVLFYMILIILHAFVTVSVFALDVYVYTTNNMLVSNKLFLPEIVFIKKLKEQTHEYLTDTVNIKHFMFDPNCVMGNI